MKPIVHNLIVKYQNDIDRIKRNASNESMMEGVGSEIEIRVLNRVISDLKSLGSKK